MDKEKVNEAFDEAKELVWTDDDEYTVGYNNGLEAGKNIAIDLLKEQKELVRCADCRHAEVSQSGLIKCRGIFRSREWYCADGERRDDDA